MTEGPFDTPTLPARNCGSVLLSVLNPRQAESTVAPMSAPSPRRTPSCYAPFLTIVPHRGPAEVTMPLPPLSVDGREMVSRAWEAEMELPGVAPAGRDCTVVANWIGIGLRICRRNASGRSEMQSSSDPAHRHILSIIPTVSEGNGRRPALRERELETKCTDIPRKKDLTIRVHMLVGVACNPGQDCFFLVYQTKLGFNLDQN
jgi:hypothetical protein